MNSIVQVGQSPCSIAQAMSALVKAVRLRHLNDAVYWYSHVWALFPQDDFRTNRRLLIISAEDNLCVPVMNTAATWYFGALKNKDRDHVYRGGVALLHMICATDNWWKDPNGWDYISLWRQAERLLKNTDVKDLDAVLAGTMPIEGTLAPFVLHTLKCADKTFDRGLYAQELVEEARKALNLPARMVAQIHASAGKLLSMDENFLGHAVYRLHRGLLGQLDLPVLNNDAVKASVEQAFERLKTPELPQPYSQDGIHCKGSDRRFAGMLPSMVSCINAYRHYGRLDPSDTWVEDFYHVDLVPTRY